MSNQFKDKLEFKGLVMRSVPDEARELFKRLAKEDFDNHYGLTLREILNSYFEYHALKEKFFTSDIDFTQLINQQSQKPIGRVIKNINGETIKSIKEEENE